MTLTLFWERVVFCNQLLHSWFSSFILLYQRCKLYILIIFMNIFNFRYVYDVYRVIVSI